MQRPRTVSTLQLAPEAESSGLHPPARPPANRLSGGRKDKSVQRPNAGNSRTHGFEERREPLGFSATATGKRLGRGGGLTAGAMSPKDGGARERGKAGPARACVTAGRRSSNHHTGRAQAPPLASRVEGSHQSGKGSRRHREMEQWEHNLCACALVRGSVPISEQMELQAPRMGRARP